MENFENIEDFFVYILDQCGSLDMAEAEFRRFLIDEPELRRRYREYCREEGIPERSGFTDFCESYIAGENEPWADLSDYEDLDLSDNDDIE